MIEVAVERYDKHDIDVSAELVGNDLDASMERVLPLGNGGGSSVPYELGETLKVINGNVLEVNTTNEASQDNTLPITSAGVFKVTGNIEALLGTI